ncbi:MAG TPA: hypothetical protein VKQ72_11680 [Aggregatilineales bacterium]|nr:hypothetical protein [Aggregatilineales bacterium]
MARSNRIYGDQFGHEGHAEALARHRRQVRNAIYLPVILAGVVLALVVVGMVIILGEQKLAVAADFMSLLILVPATLLCIVPYVAVLALAIGVTKLNIWLPRIFEPARVIISRTNDIAVQAAQVIGRPVIWIGQRAAWVEKFVAGGVNGYGKGPDDHQPPPKALPGGIKERDNA